MSSRSHLSTLIVALGISVFSLVASPLFAAEIRGQVTGADTSLPLAGVTVTAYAHGSFAGTATTDSNGRYVLTGLSADTYYLRTENALGYINEAYGDVPAPYFTWNAGTAIPLAQDESVVADFALSRGARISGTVTRSNTPEPLPGISVIVVDGQGRTVGSATSDSSGHYQLGPGLPSGQYFAATENSQGFINLAYDGVPCLPWDATAGSPIALTDGQERTDIDFSLQPGARIAGTITEQDTANVIPGVQVDVIDSWGRTLVSGATLGDGTYLTRAGLPPGTYRLRTRNSSGYINQMYSGFQCVGACNVPGYEIPLGAEETRSGIDFALARGGRISGTVTGAGLPISATVYVVDWMRTVITQTATDLTGAYITGEGLPAGSYFVMTGNDLGFVDQLYPGVPCEPSCSPWSGSAVYVDPWMPASYVNFDLALGGSISGIVTDTMGAPIAGVRVQTGCDSGAPGSSAITDEAGAYRIAPLQPGTYTVRTSNQAGYVDQMYNGYQVGAMCPAVPGTPVNVMSGQNTAISFSLEPGATLTGRVTDASTGAPLFGVSVSISNPQDPMGFWYSTNTDMAGNYSARGVPAGSYSVGFYMWGYVTQMVQPVPLSPGEVRTFDVALSAAGSISGHVSTADGGTSPTMATVSAIAVNGGGTYSQWLMSLPGDYTIYGLPAGEYRVQIANASGYTAQAYRGIQCGASCDPGVGDLVSVAGGATTAGIDFVLSRGGMISGRVVASDGTTPIPNARIEVYTETQAMISSAMTGANGDYLVAGLVTGQYRVAVGWAQGFVPEMYDDVHCMPNCYGQGSLVPVVTGETTPNINFVLDPSVSIGGTVRDAMNMPVMGSVYLYDSTGTQWIASASIDMMTGTYLLTGFPAGSYRLWTVNWSGFVNQAYPGVPCQGQCYGAVGSEIALGPGESRLDVNFVLSRGSSISGTVTDETTGNGIGNVGLVLSQQGAQFATWAQTDPSGNYTFAGLSAGSYQLQVQSAPGYMLEVFDNIPCVPYCAPTSGTAIPVDGTSPVTGINIALARGASISGTITNAQGAPIPSSGVSVYDAATRQSIATAMADPMGRYSVTGLPSGRYRVQTYNYSGYINKGWRDVVCTPSCYGDYGTVLDVTAPNETPNIDFVLAAGAAITGRVTAAGGTPLTNVIVNAYDTSGRVYTGGTMPDGSYAVNGLPPGTYRVSTSNAPGYVNEAYDNVHCSPACSTSTGTPLSLEAGGTVTVNFELEVGGQISGMVTDAAGNGVANARVTVTTLYAGSFPDAMSDSTGHYVVSGIATGTYVVRASATGYIVQMYDQIRCPLGYCQQGNGTPVQVTMGSTTGGIDFHLETGGTISVTVAGSEGASSTPVVEVYDAHGSQFASAMASPGSNAITVSGLPGGSYYLRGVIRSDGYIGQLYGYGPCPRDCNMLLGTPVSVTPGQTAGPIQITLTKGGRISGRLTAADTGGPVSGATIGVYTANGRGGTAAFANPDGSYITSEGLLPGTYYVKTFNQAGYVDQVYDGIACPAGTCVATRGTPVIVTGTETVAGISFDLARGSTISGTIVVRGSDGTPITSAGVSVTVYDDRGYSLGGIIAGSSGSYTFPSALPTGTYYARAASTYPYAVPIVSELYGGALCPAGRCTVTSGAPITVNAPAPANGIDFDLELGATITGVMQDASTGATVLADVEVFDATGQLVTSSVTSPGGQYMLRDGLAAGTYYLKTTHAIGYINQDAGGLTCLSDCMPQNTTPVVLAAGEVRTINFSLSRGGQVGGAITDEAGVPLQGIGVAVLDASGAVLARATSDNAGTFAVMDGLPAGTYYARTQNSLGYVNELYAGIACLDACIPAVASATPIAVTAGAVTRGVNFTLSLDVDGDGDGIRDSIDGDAATFSDSFGDAVLGGTTDGRVNARNGGTVSIVDVSPGGVRATLDVEGGAPAAVDVCGVGGYEQVVLDRAGDRAEVSCNAAGTSMVRAIQAAGTLHVQKTTAGVRTIVDLMPYQTVSMGSPIEAGSASAPIRVRYVDATGKPIAWFELDPNEKVDSQVAGGELRIEVLQGDVTLFIEGQAEPVHLDTGETIAIPAGDGVPPSITIVRPEAATYLLNERVLAEYSCADAESGVATCAGPVASGSAIATTAPGTFTFTVSATDAAGNPASASVSYQVGYDTALLYDAGKAGRSGSTIPLKMRLLDAAGVNMSAAGISVQALDVVLVSTEATTDVADAGEANPDSQFRYDASLGGYIFNLKTTGLGTGSYVLRFKVTGDNTLHSLPFQVR